MSWNGSIPRGKFKIKGLRNKRNQNSPKALIAMKAKAEKRAETRKERYGDDSSY